MAEFAAGVWPASLTVGEEGVALAGLPLTVLAGEFGTPLMLLDEGEVRARARGTREALTAALGEVHVYYAGKALLTTDVARWMHEEGLRIDTASEGELAIALAGGVPASQIGMHGNNKSDAYLARGVAAGVGAIVLDSAEEVDRVADLAREAGVRQPVRLRVSVGVHADTHAFLATSHEDQKFGVALAEVPTIVDAVRDRDELEFLGLHTHIGSQIASVGGFLEAAKRMLALHAEASRGGPVPELNLGGGFGIRYRDIDDALDIAAAAGELAQVVRDECARLGIPQPVLCFEPGRSIVGPAGITLYEVGSIKEVQLAEGSRRYVAVDGGMSDNLRPALYDAQHTARLVSRVSDAADAPARIVGMHCESGDILIPEEQLPADLVRGDLIAVADTGAYCHSMASNYNAVPRPGIVAVHEGTARELLRRETIDDLLRRDLGAQGAQDA